MKLNFKEAWKETLLGLAALSIFTWGIFNHLVSILMSLVLVCFAAYPLLKKLKIL